MEVSLARRIAAEVVGTGVLVLFGAGSVLAALRVGGGELDYPGLGMVAFTFAFAVAVAIYAFGTTSGAHINPAVTVSLAATGRFPRGEAPAHVVAQLVGATAGAALIVAAFGGDAVDFGTGGTTVADDVTYVQGIVAEAIGTFLLVTAVMALAVDGRAPAAWAGFVIGLAVAAAILVIGPLTGASLNPARTFGPLLVTTIGGGDTEWATCPSTSSDLWRAADSRPSRTTSSRADARSRGRRRSAATSLRWNTPRHPQLPVAAARPAGRRP